MNSPRREFEGDAGAPIPNFANPGIDLKTIAPALGVPSQRQPDYLDYDQKGRGIMPTMFANAGVSYLVGTIAGGVYGLREGLVNAPSSKMRVQLNSILNNSGRYGSRWGNALGVVAVIYSLYEGLADSYDIDDYTGPIQPAAPLLGAGLTGATYYMPAGPRVAALAGSIGVGAVGVTYLGYTAMGIPLGSRGWMFF